MSAVKDTKTPTGSSGNTPSQSTAAPAATAGPSTAAPGVTGAAANRRVNYSASNAGCSIFVGGLAPGLAQADLWPHFSHFGDISFIRVYYKPGTKSSTGFAYVHFKTPEAAEAALDKANAALLAPLKCQVSRIVYDRQKRHGGSNVYIKDLDREIDDGQLAMTFNIFGNITSCKVAKDANGNSLGFGYINFENEESAMAAINSAHGMSLKDRKVYLAKHVRKEDRKAPAVVPGHLTTVFIKSLDPETTNDQLGKMFEKYGTVTYAMVSKKVHTVNGVRNAYGFVKFESQDTVQKAIDGHNGLTIAGRVLEVKKALDRETLEKNVNQQKMANGAMDPPVNRCVLYVRNLPHTHSTADVSALFSQHGEVASIHFRKPPKGKTASAADAAAARTSEKQAPAPVPEPQSTDGKPIYSQGVAIVTMATPEQAEKATVALNSIRIEGSPVPLYVTAHLPNAIRKRQHMEAAYRQQNVNYQYNQPQYPVYPPPMMGFPGRGPMGPWMPPQGYPPMGPPPMAMAMASGPMFDASGFPVNQNMMMPPQYSQGGVPTFLPPRDMNQAELNARAEILMRGPLEGDEADKVRTITDPRILGERIFGDVESMYGDLAGKIVGMIIRDELVGLQEAAVTPAKLVEKCKSAHQDYARFWNHQQSNMLPDDM